MLIIFGLMLCVVGGFMIDPITIQQMVALVLIVIGALMIGQSK